MVSSSWLTQTSPFLCVLLLLSFVFFTLFVCFDIVRENKICTHIHREKEGWRVEKREGGKAKGK